MIQQTIFKLGKRTLKLNNQSWIPPVNSPVADYSWNLLSFMVVHCTTLNSDFLQHARSQTFCSLLSKAERTHLLKSLQNLPGTREPLRQTSSKTNHRDLHVSPNTFYKPGDRKPNSLPPIIHPFCSVELLLFRHS
ncbi:hypothetical protein ATANTOWER_003665 [Ataeniobius toweri]|uniref:Uncharacterized protein n=1 Tax=Ataeniobius toweri TaxID=208326 RepID=A0ABU7ADF1_9TELE|nr:hypothetical protein [Ataeniobius toweri]